MIKQNTQFRMMRLAEVMRKTGLSRSGIYLAMDTGSFPESIKLGARAVGWVEAEVDLWIKDRIEASRS